MLSGSSKVTILIVCSLFQRKNSNCNTYKKKSNELQHVQDNLKKKKNTLTVPVTLF